MQEVNNSGNYFYNNDSRSKLDSDSNEKIVKFVQKLNQSKTLHKRKSVCKTLKKTLTFDQKSVSELFCIFFGANSDGKKQLFLEFEIFRIDFGGYMSAEEVENCIEEIKIKDQVRFLVFLLGSNKKEIATKKINQLFSNEACELTSIITQIKLSKLFPFLLWKNRIKLLGILKEEQFLELIDSYLLCFNQDINDHKSYLFQDVLKSCNDELTKQRLFILLKKLDIEKLLILLPMLSKEQFDELKKKYLRDFRRSFSNSTYSKIEELYEMCKTDIGMKRLGKIQKKISGLQELLQLDQRDRVLVIRELKRDCNLKEIVRGIRDDRKIIRYDLLFHKIIELYSEDSAPIEFQQRILRFTNLFIRQNPSKISMIKPYVEILARWYKDGKALSKDVNLFKKTLLKSTKIFAASEVIEQLFALVESRCVDQSRQLSLSCTWVTDYRKIRLLIKGRLKEKNMTTSQKSNYQKIADMIQENKMRDYAHAIKVQNHSFQAMGLATVNTFTKEIEKIVCCDLKRYVVELLREVKLSEFTHLAWKKMDCQTSAIHRCTYFFNQISNYVAREILQQKDINRRAKCVERILEMAMISFRDRDYFSAGALHGGVNQSFILSLKKTWDHVGKKYHKLNRELEQSLSPSKNWSAVKKKMQSNLKQGVDFVPHLATITSDIAKLSSGHLWLEGRLNWSLLFRIGQPIDLFKRSIDLLVNLQLSEKTDVVDLIMNGSDSEKDFQKKSLELESKKKRA